MDSCARQHNTKVVEGRYGMYRNEEHLDGGTEVRLLKQRGGQGKEDRENTPAEWKGL